ncbi:MAG TPA: penicillin-binding protein [Anaeromyxobacteraceae bacterium]|nr:penicillin-binding protein [Anaeromyxobacteraceae bacterium]
MRTGIDPRSARWIGIRIGVVAALLGLGFAAVGARAVHLQVLQGGRLGGMARDQWLRELKQKSRRGLITDRNGALLAGSAEAESCFVDPRDFPATPRNLQRLAKALQLEAKAIEKHLARGGRFAWLKRRVSSAEAEEVRALSLPGVGFVGETRRYYPRRELAGQVLGVVGDDDEGLEGVEHAWDDSLQGESARVPSLRDARGRHVLGEAPTPDAVLEGERVELAIDQGLQLAAERALVRAVEQARAASGTAVAVNPATGEILAMANVPLLNPNAPRREDLRNRAVLDTFEPGSTMKAFVLARALDEGALRPADSLFCENGAWSVGGHVIHDHHGMGWVLPARVIAASSNICAAKVGQRLGRDRLQQAFLAFGLGERTQVGIPGEPRGQVPYPRAELSLATMSFGQGITASALQVTMAMAAIANGGILMKPALVRRIVDPASGEVLFEAVPTPVRRAVSAKSAALLSRWLEGVVADPDGTGKRARLEGWRAAGKTGTAQKADPDGGYSADRHFSSFVGFAPAGAPRVAIGVFIDEPKGEIYGGEVAAPVFKDIAEFAMRAEGVPPTDPPGAAAAPPRLAAPSAPPERDEPPAQELAPRRPPRGDEVQVPSLEGLAARTALRILEARDLSGDIRGTGRVSGQLPRAGQVVPKGSRVRLVLAPPG